MQYKIGTVKINNIKIGVNGTSPINFPTKVNGTNIAMAQIVIVNKYTVFDA